MKRKNLLPLLLLFCFSTAAFAAERPASHFHVEMKYSFTNAIEASNTTTEEIINNVKSTVQVYTFTIPFFEQAFKAKLDFSNNPEVQKTSFIVPASVPAPCKSNELKLYDAYSGGHLLGEVADDMVLHIHDFSAAAGTSNIRFEAQCKRVVYANQYFRIVVKKEAMPAFDIALSVNGKAKASTEEVKFTDQDMRFKLAGTATGNKNLFLRIIPPCGMECKRTDFNIDETVKSGNADFYTCDVKGLYDVKVIYKAEKAGGGSFNEPVSVPGWVNYSFLNEEKQHKAHNDKHLAQATPGKIRISPNPAKDVLLVELPATETNAVSEVRLMDMAGKTVLVQETNSAVFRINVSGLAKGTYAVAVLFEGKTYTEKIIKN